MTANTEHPSRAVPILAGAVAVVDDATDPARGRTSPVTANRVALDALWAGYQAGRHEAIRELVTTEQAAAALGVTERAVRAMAARRGIGWQVSRGTWLFAPADVAAMRRHERPGRKPRA